MGEALFDLERVLSKQPEQEKMTPEEVNVLSTCKLKALEDFTIGATFGSVLVWTASGKLSRFIRVNISGGAAAICGLWKFGKSLDSCVDHILGLEGTRMQRELANIIGQKYRGDPVKMKLVSKHFYSEEVFDDSTTDRPNLRWQYRNIFSDNSSPSLGERTNNPDGYGGYAEESDEKDPPSNLQQKYQSISSNNSGGLKETRSEVKHAPVKSGVLPDMFEDPLDFIFGTSTTTEEIHHLSASTASTKGPNSRSHRRSHRRRRRRHQELEDPLD